MTPPPAVAARRVSTAARTGPETAPPRQPPLRVVEQRAGRPGARWRRLPALLALAMLVGSLLVVVVGHAMLTTGQIRLSAAQARLSDEQAIHRQQVLAVARLETPSRIVSQAEQQLHLVQPSQVTQLPSVPLGVALPAPRIAPAPGSAPTVATGPPTTTPPR